MYTKISLVKRPTHYDVIIYYTVMIDGKQQQLRKSTGVKIATSNINFAKTKDKKPKPTGVSKKHPDYKRDMDIVDGIQRNIEDIIKAYDDTFNTKPSVEYIEKALLKPQKEQEKLEESFLQYFKEFKDYKKVELRAEKSLSHYSNLEAALIEFNQKKNFKLSFASIDQEWISALVYFYSNEKEYKKRNIKGNNDNVVVKRLRTFTEFLSYCVMEHDININVDKIKHFIKRCKKGKGIKQYKPTKFTLSLEELQLFVDFQVKPHQQKYQDLFIMQFLIGLRFKDSQNISMAFLQNDRIAGEATKTKGDYNTELPDICVDILKAYNYDLKVCHQKYNENLKVMFKDFYAKYKQFDTPVHLRKYKDGKIITETKKKYQCIKTRVGRATFCNLLAGQKLSLNEIMVRGGWKQISTVHQYIDERANIGTNPNIIPITRLKIA
jgi:hypothetical protein